MCIQLALTWEVIKMTEHDAHVYAIVAKIPRGKVATYGQIAALLGNPLAARQVGYAMYHAPDDAHLPCHRVVNRKGEMAPDSIFGGKSVQRTLLESEGVVFKDNGCIDMKKSLWLFD
jgi:methylated-DNA-protein-cysteine methyltransferase-like protein